MSAKKPVQWLVVAVVQEPDIVQTMDAAEASGAPVVYLSSTGGFLGNGNATLLIGLPAGLEERIISEFHQICRHRVEYMTMPIEGAPIPLPTPIPVQVGGATIFALPVERFEEM